MKTKILNYYISNYLLILLAILIFTASYYEGVMFNKYSIFPNYIDGVVFFLKDQTIFLIIIFLIPMLINSFNVLFHFEKLSCNLLRLETKNNYLKNLIETSLKVNTIYFFIIVFIIFIASFCLINKNILIIYNISYKTYNIIYLVFYLFKIYFISEWLSIVSILLYKNKLFIILNLIIYLNMTRETKIINSILNMPLLISDYLINNQYSSFSLSIICFTIYALFLILIAKIIYNLGEKQYEICNIK